MGRDGPFLYLAEQCGPFLLIGLFILFSAITVKRTLCSFELLFFNNVLYLNFDI
jgi:hypothetical protein